MGTFQEQNQGHSRCCDPTADCWDALNLVPSGVPVVTTWSLFIQLISPACLWVFTEAQVPSESETRIYQLTLLVELLLLCTMIVVKLLINPKGSEVPFEETEMGCFH